jgi:hypothetical protein
MGREQLINETPYEFLTLDVAAQMALLPAGCLLDYEQVVSLQEYGP